jgi:hypothetical protein
MHSHKVYIYYYCDEYSSKYPGFQLFTNKKDACDYFIKECYFHDLDISFDQDSRRCWYCDYEKTLASGSDIGWDWFADTDSAYDEEIGYYKDANRDKICKKCDKQMITLREYKKIQYPILLKRYEDNGIDDPMICLEEHELNF